MSLDGFVARTDHSTEEVHAWYFGGDVTVPMPNNELTFEVDEASAPVVRAAFDLGANVTGRVTFDDAEAWGGDDPMGIPSPAPGCSTSSTGRPSGWSSSGSSRAPASSTSSTAWRTSCPADR